MIIRMIIILLRFDGGSTEEEHDIAHIASSICCPLIAGFFLLSGNDPCQPCYNWCVSRPD
ncbi:hypothetical protein CUN67_10430 [Pantoea cypripedii]|uniref:Uncharacterized protein n=1 Tax=Pantoea cypripedii TaxID=55209 RepID=A0A6B9FXK7_PANCY|nr:hypothetical protein CUN67_10430 [Pantoea cypripedii]